jgi:hypothetical protein
VRPDRAFKHSSFGCLLWSWLRASGSSRPRSRRRLRSLASPSCGSCRTTRPRPIRSLADFNGVVPRCVRRLVGTDTVTPGGHPRVDQVNEVGTFDGHTRGLSHGHGHATYLRWKPIDASAARMASRPAGSAAGRDLTTRTSLTASRRFPAADRTAKQPPSAGPNRRGPSSLIIGGWVVPRTWHASSPVALSRLASDTTPPGALSEPSASSDRVRSAEE